MLGGAYCIIMNDTEAFSGHSGRMTRKNLLVGTQFLIIRYLLHHMSRSNNVSLVMDLRLKGH